jgi:hypothetical protein
MFLGQSAGASPLATAQLVPASRRTVIMKLFFMAECMAKHAVP